MPVRAKHWETADGQRFDDKKRATRHERWLELVAVCSGLIQVAQEVEKYETAPEHVAKQLLFHSKDIQRLLRANPCEGGGETEGAGDD
jgi:hypothetical protein